MSLSDIKNEADFEDLFELAGIYGERQARSLRLRPAQGYGRIFVTTQAPRSGKCVSSRADRSRAAKQPRGQDGKIPKDAMLFDIG
jgi:hypothetical protein